MYSLKLIHIELRIILSMDGEMLYSQSSIS